MAKRQSDGTTADAVARVRELVSQLSDAVAGLDGGAQPAEAAEDDQEQPDEAVPAPTAALPWRPSKGKPGRR